MKYYLKSLSAGLAGALALGLVTQVHLKAADVPVSISGFKFVPPTVTVQQGDTVTWTQKDTTGHTSTSDSSLWDSPLLGLNQKFTRTFDTAGTFPYHCTPHASTMRASVTVNAVVANQTPTVAITTPANGATLTSTNVVLEAAASDPDGSVAEVQFFEGTTSLGQATASPYRISVVLAEGTHAISAQATDNQGATTNSAVVTLTITLPVANQAPTVSLTSPQDGATFTVPASVTLTATAADPDGTIAKVEFFDGDTSLAAVASSPFQTTANLAAGPHSLTAKATDNSGATTVSTAVHIQVNAVAAAPTLSDAARTADGKFQFILHGTAGQSYQVQTSTDLKAWNTVQTVKPDSDHMTVSDSPPAETVQLFYRVQEP